MGENSPCASCKLRRRRCAIECIFAPYFPADDPHKFAIVHKVFGASNLSKMLQVRAQDPVYRCVGAISYLQNQVSQLQMQLAVLLNFTSSNSSVNYDSFNEESLYGRDMVS
ncbi:hypothetical protein CDL12_12790 [Handroanthus impetiginosus]|uniref:LOB domain-containing protein n=1 Tax=Handroanthus impetiginosus TaxID=429701 RepID=A0A2G9HAQ2_9LAMI|nr:hypothetical protein CDL12_12790 [Handroanthus impetiginosus]